MVPQLGPAAPGAPAGNGTLSTPRGVAAVAPARLRLRLPAAAAGRPCLAATRAARPQAADALDARRKLLAAVSAAVVPYMVPLAASASVNGVGQAATLQDAAPWLAVVIGALAFAAAAPARLAHTPRGDRAPRESHGAAIPIGYALRSPGRAAFAMTAEREPLTLPPLPAPGSALLTASLDDFELQEDTEADWASASEDGFSIADEPDEDDLPPPSPVPVPAVALADEALVLEWAGCDAGEQPPALAAAAAAAAEQAAAAFAVPEEQPLSQLEAVAEAAPVVLPAAAAEASEPLPVSQGAAAAEHEAAAAAEEQAEELQEQYKAKLASLKASWSKPAAAAAGPTEAAAKAPKPETKGAELKQQYDSKLAGLRKAAAAREAELAALWQGPHQVVGRIRASAQALRAQQQAGESHSWALRLAAPLLRAWQQLTQQAAVASVTGRLAALWQWVKQVTTGPKQRPAQPEY